MEWTQYRYLRWLLESGKWATLGYRESKVLVVLMSYCVTTDTCYPSRLTIARLSGVADNKLTPVFKSLIKAGLISRKVSGKGRHKVATYRLEMPPDGWTLALFPVEEETFPQRAGLIGDKPSRNGQALRKENLPATGRLNIRENLPTAGGKTFPPREGEIDMKQRSKLASFSAQELADQNGIDLANAETLIRNAAHLQAKGKNRKPIDKYLAAGVAAAKRGEPWALLGDIETADQETQRMAMDQERLRQRTERRIAVATDWLDSLPAADRERLTEAAKAYATKRRAPWADNGATPYLVAQYMLAFAIGTGADRKTFLPHYDRWNEEIE